MTPAKRLRPPELASLRLPHLTVVLRSWAISLRLLGRLLGPDFDQLNLALVSFPVDLQLLCSPITHRAGAELLLGEADIGNLLRALVEFDSRHLFPVSS